MGYLHALVNHKFYYILKTIHNFFPLGVPVLELYLFKKDHIYFRQGRQTLSEFYVFLLKPFFPLGVPWFWSYSCSSRKTHNYFRQGRHTLSEL